MVTRSVTSRDVEEALGRVLKPEAFARWWEATLPRFGMTAEDMMHEGRGDELLVYVESYSEESFT